MICGIEEPIDQKILSTARSVRAQILQKRGEIFGWCYEASFNLLERFVELEIPAFVEDGHFFIGSSLRGRLNHRSIIYEEGFEDHYWLRIGRRNGPILDVTADQFNDSLQGIRMRAIVFGYNYQLAHRYSRYRIKRRFSGN